MTLRPEPVQLAYDLATDENWVTILAARQGLMHARGAAFPARAWSLAELESAGYELVRSNGPVGLLGNCALTMRRGEDVVVELAGDTNGGVLRLHVIGATPQLADEACQWFDEALREHRLPREEARVPIHFWTMGAQGPRPMRMMIEAPTWDEIADNYTPDIRAELARSMRAEPGDVAGIALWRGEPGTGKTTALRALAIEWSSWCDVHVIVDPEVFLGDRASYLMDVLHSFEDPHTAHLEPEFPRARLIVLEDAGELVTASARANAGQALSRLLNVSDGMLGQGANISVLVTTNEQLDDLHPAVSRAGRSWARIEFDALDVDQARAWLAARGIDHDVTAPMSVADLFALERAQRS